MLKKIVIIGPESTGKSTLCEDLAQHYNTFWCPEFARQYLVEHGMNYSFDDLLTIAKGQVALEEEYIRKVNGELTSPAGRGAIVNRVTDPGSKLAAHSSPLLFIDTDLYVMKVWCEFVFGNCHSWILNGIADRQYDLYLLCATDLPWVKDELREYPDLESRERLYHIYKDLLINQTVPWVDIRGCQEERLQRAITAVNKIL